MTHPNDMTAWPAIVCQRDHRHVTRRVNVDLRVVHGYRDLPLVPDELVVSWPMYVWDPAVHPVDGGPYCPAHDAVSETIVSHHIWEPVETILCASVLAGHSAETFIDIGAQVGWFTMLALAFGAHVLAIDADLDNLALIARSATERGWDEAVTFSALRIGPRSRLAVDRARLVKVDIEGAEPEAIHALRDVDADHVLVEISPVFHDRYPAMVAELIDRGYDAFALPTKTRRPRGMHDGSRLVNITDTIVDAIPSWHQANVWFKRKGATW